MTEQNNNDKIQENIEREISKLKDKDKYPSPGDTYKDLVNKKPITEDKERKKLNANLIVGLVAIICLTIVSLTALSMLSGLVSYPESPAVEEVKNNASIINDIGFKVLGSNLKEGILELNVEVENNSDKNFYTTIRSMYLMDEDGNIILPNMKKGNIPINFFGRKIHPKTSEKALIVFDGVEDHRHYSLVIKNASDAYHYIWDYIIRLELSNE